MTENFLKILSEAETFQLVFLLTFVVVFLARLVFIILFSLRTLLISQTNVRADLATPVSLIIAVRNEEENLRKNLPKLLDVKNVDFEVIVVDDFSQDNSLSVLGMLKNGNQKLKVSSLNQETRYSVKLAQNIGLKAARNEWVMVVPASIDEIDEHWLSSLSQMVAPNISVLVNYSNIARDDRFFNLLYRVESFFLQLKSSGYTLNGLPFVYFEDNIVFKKDKYFASGGYGRKIKESYANLELMINDFILKKSTIVHLNNETAIRKSEKIGRNDYYELLKKSFRIEQYLSPLKRAILYFDTWVRLLYFPSLLFVIILFTDIWLMVITLAGILIISNLFIIKILQNRLNERKIFLPSLVYELIMPYFKVIYRWHFNWRSRNQKWKSRI